MEAIKTKRCLPKPPLPCEYFDLIGGTNGGGYVSFENSRDNSGFTRYGRIIALLLGRLRMSATEAKDCYRKFWISASPSRRHFAFWRSKTSSLENRFVEFMIEKTHSPEARMLQDGTKMFVPHYRSLFETLIVSTLIALYARSPQTILFLHAFSAAIALKAKAEQHHRMFVFGKLFERP